MSDANSQPCRVLIAGEKEELAALRATLQQKGHQTIEAEDGGAALGAIRQGLADIALLDLLMPGLNGLQILEKNARSTSAVPIILFTSFRDVRTAVEAMRRGASDYLIKPLQQEEVLRALQGALQRGRSQAGVAALRELPARFRHSHRLENLGRLTSAIAHDLNNQMTVMLGCSQLMRERPETGQSLRDNLNEIQRAAERAASLTRQLLAFSRKQLPATKLLDLNALIADMDRLFRRLLGENIVLVTDLEPDLGQVRADPGQLEQVLMNLVLNGRDAMARGGQLTITTANVFLDPSPSGQACAGQPGPAVMLRVGDNGCGMDAETQAHLFEPFFTTKERGTGLGLSIVKEIVEESGGTIQVASKLGQGTTFTICLPAAGDAKNRVGSAPCVSRDLKGSAAAPQGSETVLLVEDNDGVRSMLRESLRRFGYTVLVAESSHQALHISQHHDGPIELLVTDVVLPNMDGPELVSHLAGSRPRMKVLYMSGYPTTVLAKHGISDSATPLLQKPFSTDELALEVRQVLNGSNGSAHLVDRQS